jgi:hypothetical protein
MKPKGTTSESDLFEICLFNIIRFSPFGIKACCVVHTSVSLTQFKVIAGAKRVHPMIYLALPKLSVSARYLPTTTHPSLP